MKVTTASRSFILCMLILAFVTGGRVQSVIPAEPAFLTWVENPMIQVRPNTPPQSKRSIEISAARNETEPFQVVVTARSQKLEGVRASVSSLVDEQGHQVDKSAVSIFREHFIYVRNPSPFSTASPDWWPDALVPFVNPLNGKPVPGMHVEVNESEGRAYRRLAGARFAGSPFDVWPGQNQPLWVEVAVPTSAVPGVYHGQMTITVPNQGESSLEIQLTIWDFVLPDGAPLQTHFGRLDSIASKHGVIPGSQEHSTLYEQYTQAMAAHRIDPPVPDSLLPPLKPDGAIDWKKNHDALKRFVEAYHLRSFQIPRFPFANSLTGNRKYALRYLQSYYEYLKSQGWEKGAYYFPVDEPNSRETYQQVRAQAQLAHEANPSIRVLCTEQPYPQDASWGTLRGAVDIWCPLFPFFDEESALSEQHAGRDFWTYTALCQKAPVFHPQFSKTGGFPSLFWQIDFPTLNYRLPLWVNRRYGIKGLLYWSTVHWNTPDRDVWTDPAFRNGYNGEGYLFYPGREAGITGPVASIRLKALREGMEDYAYFSLLEKLGDTAFLDRVVSKIGSSWWNWDSDPEHLYQARAEIAERIMELQNGRK